MPSTFLGDVRHCVSGILRIRQRFGPTRYDYTSEVLPLDRDTNSRHWTRL